MNDDFAEASLTPPDEGATEAASADDTVSSLSGESAVIPAEEKARREGRFDQVTGTAINVTRTSWVFLRAVGRTLRRVFKKDSMPNLILVMTVVTVVTSAALGAVYTVTAPAIEQAKADAFDEAMGQVFPGLELTFAQSSIADNVFEGRGLDGTLAGFAVRVTTGGYGGDIDMIVGISVLRQVTGVAIVNQRETRGFDAKGNMQNNFTGQFIGHEGPFIVGESVDAVSGATVSSKAVTQGVNEALTALEGGSNP